jgi:hypothetical protein
MSAFNPLPDQLQQDSGSPAQDVMAPPDQQAPAAPQPTTPSYPPSPDQGGPVPQSSPDPDAGSNTHGWRAVLRGALSGLESHLEGAGKGLITGGIPGAVVGAISPGMADNALAARTAMQNARVQTAQAQAASAQQDVQIAKDNHEAQMALTHVNLLTAQNAYDLAPKSVQDMIDQQEEKFTGQLQMEGFQPVQSGIDSMTDANNIALARNQTDNNSAAFSYVPLRATDGSWSVFHISTPNQPLQNDATLPLLKADGTVTSIPVRKGSMSVGQYMQLYTQRVNDIGKQQSAAAAKIEISNATGNTGKNEAIANKDNSAASANAPATPTTDSLGVTITPPAGGAKATTKLQGQFKKDADDLAKTESTYDMFQDALGDVNSGKDITGAKSVTTLFAAIGLSATPLKGMGMRINQNTVAEHIGARDVGQSLYAQLLKVKDGDIITPQQIKDYASIATVARQSAYVNKINEARSYGLDPSFLLPAGNGRHVDPSTAQIFVAAANGNKDAARQAAQKKGWRF